MDWFKKKILDFQKGTFFIDLIRDSPGQHKIKVKQAKLAVPDQKIHPGQQI